MSEVETEAPDEPQEPVGEPESPDEEEPDADTPAEPDGPQEAAQTPVAHSPSDLALEEMAVKGEKKWNNYKTGMEGIYQGSGKALLPCPLCPSQHKGFVDVNFAGRIPEEVEADVKSYMGLARPVDYRPSKVVHECPSCVGEGQVSTGSKVGTHKTRTCEECKGYGYVPPPGEPQGNGVTGPTAFTPETLDRVLNEPDDRDEWGEPRLLPDGRENPNFGRMPNRKVLVDPWGQTAGLSAFDAVSYQGCGALTSH